MSHPISALEALGFALAARPNGYTLLLGSGVSSAAGVLTGWEIIGELSRRLAKTRGESPDDPWSWYEETFHAEPDYSVLLSQLARAPRERTALLRAFFEPTAIEREAGVKVPTPAHHAIAALVEAGYIRNVITTNFDRLLEQAYELRGLSPVVVASEDAVYGAPPLHHGDPIIVKLHGDYLDGRLRNTTDELSRYDERLTSLLDRLFSDFGIVVCGWSGQWDSALRDALKRTSNWRFTTFWTYRDTITDLGAEIIKHRRGVTIPISNADSFFSELHDLVQSLSEIKAPHPEAVSASVASLKRYLVNDSERIKLDDLVMNSAEETVERLQGIYSEEFTTNSIELMLRQYNSAVTRLRALAIAAGYWGSASQLAVFGRAIRRVELANRRSSGIVPLLRLASYPALTVFVAATLSTVLAARYDSLAALFDTRPMKFPDSRESFVDALTPGYVLSEALGLLRYYKRRHTKAEDYLRNNLRKEFIELVREDEDYNDDFDWLEYLLALRGAYERNLSFALGRFAWKRGLLEELEGRLRKEHTALVDSRVFEDADRFYDARDRVRAQVKLESWIR